MVSVLKLTTLDQTSAALLILKGGFDSHASGIFPHALMRSGPIGDQQPGFLIPWLPTSTEPADKLVLLPQQDLSIPLLARLVEQLLTLLPGSIGVPKPPSTPVLLFDAQDVMPIVPDPTTLAAASPSRRLARRAIAPGCPNRQSSLLPCRASDPGSR